MLAAQLGNFSAQIRLGLVDARAERFADVRHLVRELRHYPLQRLVGPAELPKPAAERRVHLPHPQLPLPRHNGVEGGVLLPHLRRNRLAHFEPQQVTRGRHQRRGGCGCVTSGSRLGKGGLEDARGGSVVTAARSGGTPSRGWGGGSSDVWPTTADLVGNHRRV